MTVFSRAHLMLENVEARNGKSAKDNPFLVDLQAWPSFVIQADAFELLKRADCANAIQALVEADIFKLPHPKMAIEFCVRTANYGNEFARSQLSKFPENHDTQMLHEFVLLEEIPNGIRMRYGFLYVKDRIGGIGEFYCDATPFNMTQAGDLRDIIPTYHPKGFDKADNEGGFLLSFSAPDIDPKVRDTAVEALLMAINIAFVLMNMKGIEQEEHNCEALNKHRRKKNKPEISQYSYVRIGHVYRADGSRVKYTDGSIRSMPMHVRTAHTRRQHYGKENSETKIIYAPSCIVNFNPGEELKKPKQKIVKA